MTQRTTRRFLAAAIVCALPALAWAQTGLKDSAHDFTAGAAPGSGLPVTKFTPGTGGVSEIGLCTYCHTPHKAQSTALLWNHALSSNVFSWSDATTTTAGTALPTTQLNGQTYKGPSTRCLSCHDGTVAIGDVAWFYEVSRTSSGNGVLNATKTSDATMVNPNTVVAGEKEFLISSTTGDMKGNHPVGIPYPTFAGSYNGITSGTGININEWVPNPVNVNSTVSNIRLFSQDGSGNTHAIAPGSSPTNVGIECSSCHDPHNKQATDDLFLRGKIAGNDGAQGYICLQCHQK